MLARLAGRTPLNVGFTHTVEGGGDDVCAGRHLRDPADRQEEARAGFQEAIARIGESPGLKDAYFLLGTESDRAITITLWDNHEAMAASRVAASRLRSDAAASVGGDVVSVDEFEVVAGEDGSAS